MKSKKVFIFLMAALILAGGAVLGAQELKLDGYLNSGLGFWTGDAAGSNGDEHQLLIYGVDSERYVGRFRLNGAFTNANKNAGVNFRFQVQGNGQGSPANTDFSLAYGYGWVKFFDDVVTLKAGFVDDGTFTTADVLWNDDNTEGAGIFAKVSPIKGLDFGLGGYVGSYRSGSSNNIIPTFTNNGGSMDFADAKYTFSAAYTMDKMIRLMASLRTENKATGRNYGSDGYQRSQALIELRLLAVDGLTAVVVGQLYGILDDGLSGSYQSYTNKFSDNGQINFYETFGYKLGDISIGLNAAQYVSNRDDQKDMGLQFNPWVSYALNEGKIVPRLDLVYFMGGIFGTSDSNSAKNVINYQRRGFSANYDSDSYVFNIRPSVKFFLDSRNSLEIGDSIYLQKVGANGDNTLDNVFYLDFVTRF